MIATGKLSVAATVMLRAFAGAIPAPRLGSRNDRSEGHRYRRNQRERRRDERRTGRR